MINKSTIIPSDENIAALESAVSDKVGRNVRIYFGDAPISDIDEIYAAATRDATADATRDATVAATRDATVAATRDATVAATRPFDRNDQS